MEVEMMVISDDGRAPRTVTNDNGERAQRRNRINFFHLASLCLTMAILAFIFAAALLISTPNDKKSMKKNEKRSNRDQGLLVKGFFSTNYELDNYTHPITITNLDEMTKQLNTILQKELVQLTDAFFVKDSSHNHDQQISCDTLFNGLMLHINMIVRDSHSYLSKDLFEQLKMALDQVQTMKMLIRLENNQLQSIDLKICHLDQFDSARMILKKTQCDLYFSRIKLVSILGGQGSHLYDDLYSSSTNVTLEDDSIYQLRIQFECDRETCELPQDIYVWIDFNDNGLDDDESRLLRRSRTNRKHEGNTYYLELFIPTVDGQQVRTGNHRMLLNTGPSKKYQRECGSQDYDKQNREYMAHIIKKSTDRTITKIISGTGTSTDPLCSQPVGRISLVLMAGERGTEIRDDQRWSTNLNHYEYDRHHLSVTIYEDTLYLIRIQLDCSWQLNIDQYENGCNLAQDIHVWMDGVENRPPYRWPVTSYMAQGIYDLQLYVPSTDNRYLNIGSHRMLIVVTHNQQYHSICGNQEYNETREYSVKTISRNEYITREDVSTRPIMLQNIICATYVGKVIMVLMAGEHRTQIRDDQSHAHRSIVLFENTVYQLRIQLDCNRAWASHLLDHSCSLVYDVNVWIDLNDDGIFDRSENAVPYRWPLHSYTPQGVYDLQVYIPRLDSLNKMNTGLHRMQLIVTMNQQYRDKCGDNDYREIREYQVSVVSRMIQPVDTRMSYLKLSDNVCLQKNGKIALVLMAGEQGTLIRDNLQLQHRLNDNQNRHHLSITLYENTIYRIRIQLDCFPHGKGGYPDNDCNVAQDVNVIIDFNHDNQFDEKESRIPQRWPLISSMSLGIYDLEINIPTIGDQGIESGSHRMQVVVTSSEEYRRKCGNTNYREIREYIVNIVPREASIEMKRSMYCLPTNLVCSSGYYGFALIELMGEEGSEIRDDMKRCDPINNYHDRTDQLVILFANRAYTMYIELYCIGSSIDDRKTCYQSQQINVWIDWNNDGIFDDTNELIFPKKQNEINSLRQGYHLQIFVPNIDDSNDSYRLRQQHRMRIVIRQDQGNYHPCHINGYGEAKDYSIRLIL